MAEMNGWVWEVFRPEYLKIHLVGCGGTGGRVLAPLMKIFPRQVESVKLTLWDGDVVESRNLLRQNFAPEEVGLNKAEVLADRLAGMEERFQVCAKPRMLDEDGLRDDISTDYNIILGCTDSPAFRQMMNRWVTKKLPSSSCNLITLWLDAGNARTTGQVVWNGGWYGKISNLLTKVDDSEWRPIKFSGLAKHFPRLVDGSRDTFDQGCGMRLDLQTTAVNQLAATWMICLLSNLLSGRKSNSVGVTFSTDGESQRIVMGEVDHNQVNAHYNASAILL